MRANVLVQDKCFSFGLWEARIGELVLQDLEATIPPRFVVVEADLSRQKEHPILVEKGYLDAISTSSTHLAIVPAAIPNELVNSVPLDKFIGGQSTSDPAGRADDLDARPVSSGSTEGDQDSFTATIPIGTEYGLALFGTGDAIFGPVHNQGLTLEPLRVTESQDRGETKQDNCERYQP